MFKLSARSLKALEGVHPDLVKWVKATLAHSSVDFVVIEGLRTEARQKELVASGASQMMNSRHLTGHAVDLAAWVGAIRWDMGLYYRIAEAGQKACDETGVPIRWGGSWSRLDTSDAPPDQMVADYVAARRKAGKKSFVDAGHFELSSAHYP